MRRIKSHTLSTVGLFAITWCGGSAARSIAFCSVSRRPRQQLQQTTTESISVTSLEGFLWNGTMGRSKSMLQGQRNNSGDKKTSDDVVTSIVQRVASIAATPLLSNTLKRPLAMGYVLVLLASVVFLPPSTSFLLVLSFGLFAWFGRNVIGEEEYDEDDDEGDTLPTDALALGAAGLTVGILAPVSSTSSSALLPFDMVSTIIGTALLFVMALILQQSQSDRNEGAHSPPIHSVDDPDADPQDDLSSNEKRLMTLWDQSLNKSNDGENGA